jgi:hypothetical protein
VTPDVSVPSTNALDIALDRAREDLRKREDVFSVAAFIELR